MTARSQISGWTATDTRRTNRDAISAPHRGRLTRSRSRKPGGRVAAPAASAVRSAWGMVSRA